MILNSSFVFLKDKILFPLVPLKIVVSVTAEQNWKFPNAYFSQWKNDHAIFFKPNALF